MSVDIKIISDKLPAMLEQLPELVQQIIEKTGSDIQAAAQQAAPVKTGYLRSSIQFEMTGPAEGTISVGANYGPPVEYGTVHMPARPYLTPAVEANRQPFADAWKQIEELAK